METYFIYFGLVILSLLNSMVSKYVDLNLKRILAFILLFLITFVVGLRSVNVGSDTISYFNSFNFIRYENIGNFRNLLNNNFLGSERLEPGFVYLNKFLNSITSNPQILLFLESVLLYWSICLNISHLSLNPSLSVFFVLTGGIFITSMNLLRQYMALALCFLGYYFWTKSEKKRALFIIILAAICFHRTAIFFLILFLTDKIKFNKKSLAIGGLIALGSILLFNPIMQIIYKVFPYYASYSNKLDDFGSGKIFVIFNILLCMLTLIVGLYCKKVGRFDSVFTFDRWNELSFMILISIIITAFSWNFTQADRISQYFRAFMIIYIPNCIYMIKNKKIVQGVLLISYVVIFVSYFTYMLVFKDNWNNVVLYLFCF